MCSIFFLLGCLNTKEGFETHTQTIMLTFAKSVFAYWISDKLIITFKDQLRDKGLFGRDLNKSGIQKYKKPVPEALGIVISIIFLVITIQQQVTLGFTKDKLIEYNASILAICMVVLLGFVDDVIDLKWRHKVIVPTVASFPLLVAYNGLTSVVVPKMLRPILGNFINLGPLYYLYMGNIAIFCTNAINIHAGINGIEVGQSFIIGLFIMIHNIIEIFKSVDSTSDVTHQHMFSLTIIIPFLLCTLALLKSNKFPSKVFVGDTFCYCAGMTFAVVGILGHFSKTLMLFFIPQLINFFLSVPQLLGIIHCPRHRLPKFNQETYRLECVPNHFTLINAWLRVFGPTNEKELCNALVVFQIITCALGLFVRYYIGDFFF
jgi:UDP-N-acetylglucosamine--dolichyl-phosphate N-acetylglucosaminephosphotransferase